MKGRSQSVHKSLVKFVVRTVRPRIERVFGTLKRSCGLVRARSLTLARNHTDIAFKILAFNLRRAITRADAE